MKLDVGTDVSAALAEGRPVVAMETTVITHGMAWPENLDVTRDMQAAIRAAGALRPATTARSRSAAAATCPAWSVSPARVR